MNSIEANNTFTESLGKDRQCPVVIGNPDAPDEFQAHVRLEFWSENNITLCDKGVKGTPALSNDKLTVDCGKDKSIEWRKQDESTLKWLITFKEKPERNVYTFDIGGQYAEFEWNYQPSLALEYGELEEFVGYDGDIWVRPKNYAELEIYDQRPLKVEGSYAVKHKHKRDHVLGQSNYRAGIAFHVYTPKATDAVGKTVQTILHISGGVYTVTIPQNFLDEAVYPVVVNDEFGFHTLGASETVDGTSSDNIFATGPYSPASDGSATEIWWGTRAGTNQVNGLFANNAGVPTVGAPIRDGANVGGVGPDWFGGAFDSPVAVLAANSYWIANQRGDSIAWRYNAGSSTGVVDSLKGDVYNNDGVMTNWANVDATYTSRDYSAYIVYTPSGAAGQPTMRRRGGVPGMQLTGRRSW